MPVHAEKKSTLITGGAGFIASHVAVYLAQKQPHTKIIVLDKLDYCSSLKSLVEVSQLPSFEFIKGDVRSPDLLNHLFYTENIDTVLHFAAQSHVDNSFGNSIEFTKNNIEGTHVLLETCRLARTVKCFIHVSTDEVYGESSFVSDSSNKEDLSLLSPTNPYSATKAAAEMLVLAYGRSYGLPYIITRGNNVYGPRQYPEKAIPKFTILAHRAQKISLHGDGMATRSYMHIDDVVQAFNFILEHGQLNEVYNIGSDEEHTILSVATDICKLMRLDPSRVITHVRDRAYNDRRYLIDTSKLRALGWSQKVSWREGLKTTVEWYKNEDLASYWGEFAPALRPHPLISVGYLPQHSILLDDAEGEANAALGCKF